MSLGRLMELEDRVVQLEVAVARLVDRLDRAKFPEYDDESEYDDEPLK